MKIRKLFLVLLVGLLYTAVYGQNKRIEGTVLDDNGEPLIGASVVVKGSPNVGIITDADGKFVLNNVPESARTLIVSYIGMATQEVSARSKVQVIMSSDEQMLEETIVVAFGEQKKSAFTGSAAVIDSKKLESKLTTNVISALQGEAAGVQMVNNSGDPNATPSLRIRGFSSINAGQSPLIIVDGAPYDGGWNNLNPNDVESVTVLKDAASNALYGARGANGVLMITTKKGKAGKASITLDTKWGVNQRINRDYNTISEPGLYYETHYKALANYYKNEKAMSPFQAHQMANEVLGQDANVGGLGYICYTVPEGQYLIGENGKLNPNATLGGRTYYNGQVFTVMPDSWRDEAFRTGLRQEYNLNVSGGTDAFQAYASIGYLSNEGYARNSDFERYSARLRMSYDAKKWLKLGGNVNFSNSKSNYVGSGSSDIFALVNELAPIYPVYIRDAEGKIMVDDNGLMYDYGDGSVNGLIRTIVPQANPIQENSLTTSDSEDTQFSINGFADIKFLKDFKFTVNGTITRLDGKSTWSPQYFYGSYKVIYPTGYVQRSQSQETSYNTQQLLNYNHLFGKHNVSLLLGHEYYKDNYDYLWASRKTMASFFENQTLSGAIKVDDNGDDVSDYNNEGFFFRGQYDFDEKYFGSFSLRRDASSRFHPKHRWGTFYSIGGAWIMSKEKWLNEIEWLSELKLKASFGQQGNDAIGNYRYIDTYSIKNSNDKLAFSFKGKGNENITWETNNNFNTGIEFDLFKGRLTGSVEYFYRLTTNMLSQVYGSYSSGIHSTWENVGNMTNSGVEFDVKGVLFRNRNFEWSVNANATVYKNKVTRISDELKSASPVEGYYGYESSDRYVGEGLPLYEWYMPKYAGVSEEGKSMWYRTTSGGEVTTTDVYGNATFYLCGSPHPDVYGGFGTTLSYRGFDFSIGFTYSLGGKTYDSGYATFMTCPTGTTVGEALHYDVLKAWSEENPNSNIPRWQYGDSNSTGESDRFLVDGSYLTLQNLNMGYNLPTKWARRLALDGLRLYVAADNLWYWSYRYGLDPRGSFTGNSSAQNYSSSRTISGGITLRF